MVDGVENSGTISLPREAIDEVVVAWDAHTGKELGRKVFAAREHCPVSPDGNGGTLQVRPDDDEVITWVTTL